jgi:hypothetical protein
MQGVPRPVAGSGSREPSPAARVSALRASILPSRWSAHASAPAALRAALAVGPVAARPPGRETTCARWRSPPEAPRPDGRGWRLGPCMPVLGAFSPCARHTPSTPARHTRSPHVEVPGQLAGRCQLEERAASPGEWHAKGGARRRVFGGLRSSTRSGGLKPYRAGSYRLSRQSPGLSTKHDDTGGTTGGGRAGGSEYGFRGGWFARVGSLRPASPNS